LFTESSPPGHAAPPALFDDDPPGLLLVVMTEAEDRLLTGELVKDRSGEDTIDAVVAVEELLFVFLNLDVVGICDLTLLLLLSRGILINLVVGDKPFMAVVDAEILNDVVPSRCCSLILSEMSKTLWAENRWPILANDRGSLL
jgi:hypothetical protein